MLNNFLLDGGGIPPTPKGVGFLPKNIVKRINIQSELHDIGQMLCRADILNCVRQEVQIVMSRRRAKVMDGSYSLRYGSAQQYDVVITDIGGNNTSLVARRLREKFPDMEITELVRGVLGIRTARRMAKRTDL